MVHVLNESESTQVRPACEYDRIGHEIKLPNAPAIRIPHCIMPLHTRDSWQVVCATPVLMLKWSARSATELSPAE